MSRKYKSSKEVPTEVLSKRLGELSDAVTKGKAAIDREFVMRIPAEGDYCPDLVMSEAARRLTALSKLNPQEQETTEPEALKLLAEVRAFNQGQGKYDFSGLNEYDRANESFDAWQAIANRIDAALNKN